VGHARRLTKYSAEKDAGWLGKRGKAGKAKTLISRLALLAVAGRTFSLLATLPPSAPADPGQRSARPLPGVSGARRRLRLALRRRRA